MKFKQMYGVLGVAIGVALIGISIYTNDRVHQAREDVDTVSGFFSTNPVSRAVKQQVHGKLSGYDMLIRLSMIGGIVIGAAGVYILIRCRKR